MNDPVNTGSFVFLFSFPTILSRSFSSLGQKGSAKIQLFLLHASFFEKKFDIFLMNS